MRIIVFGTFDLFHEGHRYFLKKARSFGNHLTVVVARDKFVEKAKGRRPRFSEEKRAAAIRKEKVADKVILGSKTHNFFRTIRTNKIDLIALGYDQKPSIWQLKKELRKHRLKNIKVVRLKAYKPNVFKSSLLNAYEV